MKTNKSKLRILPLLIAVALLLAALPTGALAEGSFSAAVKSKKMKVYADAQGQNYLGSLPKKTIVTVENYTNGVAKIKYNGMTGYAKVSDMLSVESFAETAKTTQKCRVYQQPSTASKSVQVKKGVKMHVLAVENGVAMVERSGKIGYMNAAYLKYGSASVPSLKEDTSIGGVLEQLPDSVVDQIPDSVMDKIESGEVTSSQLEALKEALEAEYKKQQEEKQEEEKKDTPAETIKEAFASGKYSNEQLCYLFATKVMGYNHAAASGLLANISAESGFRTNANGDSGRSYGICQWFSSRKNRLLNWCDSNGMDSATLGAQLYFLKYELETYYPSVNRYMKNVDNNAQGAYDAAYYFCYHFEGPANKAAQSASRGNKAMNTYYPKYI